MKLGKALSIVLVSALLMGVTTLIPNTPSAQAAVNVPYVKPEIIQEQWAIGDYVNSIGQVFEDAARNVGFKTSKAEPGTLVVELRKKEYCCWESIRTSNATYRAFLYNEPYMLDGRNESAPAATDIFDKAMDFINKNDKENFYLRIAFNIKKPDSDHTYWLAFLGSNDPRSYYYKAYFYPGVNLVPLSRAQRDAYFKGQNINIGASSGNNTGSNTSNKPTIPKLNVKYIGRLVVKSNNVAMYNSKGEIHRRLKRGEDIRVYAIQGNRYLIGGGYYVLKSSSTSFYVGTIYSKKGDMVIYSPNGKVYKKIKPKQTVKVYSTKNNVYQIGGGYYVLPGSNIVFQR
ncbi:hypothetical protein [Anoxybacteroides tepidamans]|uniref:hypothetical protein n=1 Tax=Anoxybacteroides tepidamans TaxID=265948 RepID=UPI0004860E12|nr:hypothetical protein [Anoxybacillus tepidamans]